MAIGFSDYEILLGAPVSSSVTVSLLPVGGAGEIDALRTLTHPDSDAFPPIVYGVNPDRTSNLLDEALPMPIASVRRTIGTTLLTRFEAGLGDVVCEERWDGAELSKAAMPGYQLRQLRNYWMFPPPLVPAAQEYIVWRPRDVSDKAYNVELYQIVVGTGSQAAVWNLKEFRLPEPPVIDNGLGQWDVPFTGMIDQPVTVFLKVVSEFVP